MADKQTTWRLLLMLMVFLLTTSLSTVQGHGSFQQAVWGSSTPSDMEQQGGSTPDDMAFSTKPSRGGWSFWSPWSVCSRPCDGGVARQLRRCSSPQGCRGEPVRYKICNMQACPSGQDFRARQCSAYDQVPYEGALLQWTPHLEPPEPCALTCRGRPHNHPQDSQLPGSDEEDSVIVVQLAPRVQDGTRCRPGSLDMCISGKCQRVGCDLRIGSNRRVDECGVCGGDGSSCARPLYQWDSAPMSLCSVTCGGGYRMSRPVCRNRVTGTDVEEQLCNAAQRPEPAVQQCNSHQCPPKWSIGAWGACSASCGGGNRARRVTCSVQGGNGTVILANEEACSGRKPRHLEPCNEEDCPQWMAGQWSGCSVSCGSGVQVRMVRCGLPSGSHGGHSDILEGCPQTGRPPAQRPCSTGIVCPVYRDSGAEDDIEDLLPGIVYHTQPLIQTHISGGGQATAERLIGEQAVPSEATFIRDSEWSPCSATCGEGIRRRAVHCKIFLEFSRAVAKLPDFKCPGPKPQELTERCVLEPCSMAYGASLQDHAPQTDTYGLSSYGDHKIRVASDTPGTSFSWKEQGYTHCSASCLSGDQELIINCIRDDDQKIVSPYMCSPNTKPESRIRACNDIPCPPRWNYSDFSACTKSCGLGIQTREVTCIHEVTRGGDNTRPVPSSMCPQPPPPDRKHCNVLDCPVRWHTEKWSKCNKPCGGGIKERKVQCRQTMAQGHVVDRPDSACAGGRPISTKTCHTKSCVLDTSSPQILVNNSSYIQHDSGKKKITLKVGKSATIFYGTQVKIKCPVKRFDRTKIQWAKDKTFLQKSKKYRISKKGALRIQEVRFQDGGVYTCIAGKSTANLTLYVKQPHGEYLSSEEIGRSDHNGSPYEDPNDSVDRDIGPYGPFVGGNGEDQSHEQKPGSDHTNIFKQKDRERAREKERARQRERERQMQTTSQMSIRYYPDDENEKEMGSGNQPGQDDTVPSQMSVAGGASDSQQTSAAHRPMPHILRILSNLQLLWPFQTFSNSRGHRMISDLHYSPLTEELSITSAKPKQEEAFHFTKQETNTQHSIRHEHAAHSTLSEYSSTSSIGDVRMEETTEESFTEAPIQDNLDAKKEETLEILDQTKLDAFDLNATLVGVNSNMSEFDERIINMEESSLRYDLDVDNFSFDMNNYSIAVETNSVNKITSFRDNDTDESSVWTISDEDDPVTVVSVSKEYDQVSWLVSDWSQCSLTCGGAGLQMRAAHCMMHLDNTTHDVSSSSCDSAGLAVPVTIRKCGLEACPTWRTTEWSPCSSARCFDWNTAMQRRDVTCQSFSGSTVSAQQCAAEERPPHRQECYNDKCRGVWKTDQWSECGGACGEQGARYRILRCVWFGTKRPAGSACRHRPRPLVVKPCQMRPCIDKKTECKDSSKFCQNVRAMNMCHVQRYQLHCCQSCKKH